MNQLVKKAYWLLFCSFSGLFPFFIYPWGKQYYYANGKAYYLIGWMFLLGVLAISRIKGIKQMAAWKISSLEWVLIFFLCLIGCSTLLSKNPSLVGDLTEHQGILVLISYGVLFSLASRTISIKQQQRLCDLIVVCSFFAAVYGIFQHYGLTFLPQDLVYTFGKRSFSFFDNPDYFGSYLVLMIPISLALFLSSQERKKDVLYFIITCTLFLSLLESETRSAWLGTAMGIILLAFGVVRKRKQLWRKWVPMTLLFVLIFAVSNAVSRQSHISRAITVTHDVQQIITNENAGAAGASRWYIWQASVPLIERHFWLGSGPNTFQAVFHPTDPEQSKKYLGGGKIYDENNDYMQMALTMGVPALLVYLLFLSLIVIAGFKKAKALSDQQQILMYGLLAAIMGYLVQANFNISVVSVAPYFWMFLGFAVGKVRVHNMEDVNNC